MIPLTRRLKAKLVATTVVAAWAMVGPPLSGRHLLLLVVAASAFWEIRVTRVRERAAASEKKEF